MEVAPEKAKKRREQAAKEARLERWAEASGNAGLAGRELPPAQALAADQRVNAWARQLRQAGVEGSMDELRARAYLDILLNRDSRLAVQHDDADGADGPGWPEPTVPSDRGGGGVIPAGFAGKINLTITATTLLDLAHRPGEISGIGPIHPDLARDLARAAAANPKTTWCLTVTDQDGHAIGHGCARPEPRNDRARRGKPGGHDPPGSTSGPRFTFTPDGRDGPPDGWAPGGATGIPGRPDLIISIGPIISDPCDHRHQARGHDPGVTPRHLTEIRYATCTGPGCRRPSAQSDFENKTPDEAADGPAYATGTRMPPRPPARTHPGRTAEHLADETIRWTMPSGRQYTTEPAGTPFRRKLGDCADSVYRPHR